jgi:hypothetical protein
VAELIQAGSDTLFSEVHNLLNSTWNKEELPQQWNESISIPTYRKGDKTDCSNYQGISLLSTSCKIIYSILLLMLSQYADEIIGTHQCGFQHSRSTTDQNFFIR